MTNQNTSIIFMGTPDFAVPPLKALKEKGFNILLAVAQPDRKKGRGKKMLPPPVKVAAEELGIEVFQPEKIKTEEAVAKLKSLEPDFLVVAAYGQILSKEILDIPKKAPINIHASILPKYRGASPIQHSVCDLEKETGITTMFMDIGLDTGDILHVDKTDIKSDETAGELHDRLGEIGAKTIVHTIENFDEIKRIKQNDSDATYAPLLKKEDGHIDWTMESLKIDAKIRGYSPWPGSFAFNENDRIKIYKIETTEIKSEEKPGTIVVSDNDTLEIATGDKNIKILELQPAGKKRMKVSDFLKGYKIKQGMVLT